MKDFQNYQKWFEAAIGNAVHQGLVGRVEPVPVLAGKLARTNYGRFIGARIPTTRVLAIDYYGLLKKSEGFFASVRGHQIGLKGRQLKTVSAPVVHFASLKLEDMAKIEPSLLRDFANYKNTLLVVRGFKGR